MNAESGAPRPPTPGRTLTRPGEARPNRTRATVDRTTRPTRIKHEAANKPQASEQPPQQIQEARPVAAPETFRPEGLTPTQSGEIDVLSNSILESAATKARGEATPTPAQERIKEIHRLTHEPAAASYRTSSMPEGITLTGNLPEVTTTNPASGQQEQLQIRYIVGSNESELYCVVLPPGTDIKSLDTLPAPVAIPRVVVADALLVAEADTILSGLSGAEQQVMELKIKALRGEQLPDNVNEIISKGANEMGFVTNDNLRSFVNKEFADLPPEAAAADPNKQAARKDKRERLLKRLEGKVIADAPTMVALLEESGVSRNNLTEKLQNAEQQLKKLNATKPNVETKAQHTADVAEEKAKIELYKKALKATSETAIQDQINNLAMGGTADKATRQKIIKAFSSGDTNALLEATLPQTQGLGENVEKRAEAIRKAQERHDKTVGRLKKAGLTTGAITAILMFLALSGMGQH